MKTVIASKRQLIRIGAGPVALAAPVRPARAADDQKSTGDKGPDLVTAAGRQVNPPEDLMRAHGVLDRVLLIGDAPVQRRPRPFI